MATTQVDNSDSAQWIGISPDGSTDPFTFRSVINNIIFRGADPSVLEERRLNVPMAELRDMEEGDLLPYAQQIYEEWQRVRVLLKLSDADGRLTVPIITYELFWGELRFRLNGALWLKSVLVEINWCRGLLSGQLQPWSERR